MKSHFYFGRVVVNITLGLWLYGSRHTQNQFSAFWLWIAVLIIFSIWDSLTFLYSKFYWPWRQKEDKKENGGTEMTEKSDLSKNSDEKPKKKPSKVNTYNNILLDPSHRKRK